VVKTKSIPGPKSLELKKQLDSVQVSFIFRYQELHILLFKLIRFTFYIGPYTPLKDNFLDSPKCLILLYAIYLLKPIALL